MNHAGAGERMSFRAPRGANLAIKRAAIRAHMTPGELARRLFLDGLRANGFELLDEATRTADVLAFARS